MRPRAPDHERIDSQIAAMTLQKEWMGSAEPEKAQGPTALSTALHSLTKSANSVYCDPHSPLDLRLA